MDKDKINVIEWQYFDYVVTAYTAEWCGPCRRIKPYVYEYFNESDILKVYDINKQDYKKNVNDVVPFFVVSKNEVIIDKIQTSDQIKFINFMSAFKN